MSFSAEVIADSKSEIGGHRLTTVKATFPRYLLAEFNTHKMISKNSASSRAIPAKKLIESVEKNPYIPEKWMRDHKGMQGSDYLNNGEEHKAKTFWLQSLYDAIGHSKLINGLGVTKQTSNRLLEPFMYHTALMSATEWENFFALRAEGAAEINFQKSAFQILDVMNASTPKVLKPGEWHLPFTNLYTDILMEVNHYWRNINNISYNDPTFISKEEADEIILKIVTAKCAGVSYVVVGEDGKEEPIEKLIERHDKRLVAPGHWSPMEHPAKVMNEEEYFNFTKSFILYGKHFDWYMSITDPSTFRHTYNSHTGAGAITEYGWCGNYRGFIQYRKMFINENRTDSRLIKK